MQASSRGAVPYQRARELVDDAVARRIKTWAKTIGLQSKDILFAQFCEDMTETLHACMRTHIAGQYRRYERLANMRKDLLALAKAALKAAEAVRKVQSILDHLGPMQHDPPFRLQFSLPQIAAELEGTTQKGGEVEGLANAARQCANEFKRGEAGGKLRMRAFNVFAEGLVRAYRNATGRSGVGRSAREGELLDLYEAVVPTACEVAKGVTEMPPEVSDDPGDYLHRIARRL
jgi:hypothetical protein